ELPDRAVERAHGIGTPASKIILSGPTPSSGLKALARDMGASSDPAGRRSRGDGAVVRLPERRDADRGGGVAPVMAPGGDARLVRQPPDQQGHEHRHPRDRPPREMTTASVERSGRTPAARDR